jgi:bis(5'-adenosyl)-triphosphatase
MPSIQHKSNCPFCGPDVEASVFFDDGDFLAIYNIAPVLPGHSLVIPKAHKTSLLQLNDDEMFRYFITSRKALAILLKAFETDAFDWSIQEKPEAGQSIEHLHLHIVPRLKHDLPQPGDWYPLVHRNDKEIIDSTIRKKISPESLKTIITRLRNIADYETFKL